MLIGKEEQAKNLLSKFGWGDSFWGVNEELFELYSGCKSSKEVEEKEKQYQLELVEEEKRRIERREAMMHPPSSSDDEEECKEDVKDKKECKKDIIEKEECDEEDKEEYEGDIADREESDGVEDKKECKKDMIAVEECSDVEDKKQQDVVEKDVIADRVNSSDAVENVDEKCSNKDGVV